MSGAVGDRRALLGGLLLAAGATAAVLLVDPFDDRGFGCPLHEVTGLQCPGCGSTRAAWLLLHGDLDGVFRHNALFLPALLVLIARWAYLSAPAWTAWLPPWIRSPTEVPKGVLRGVVVLLAVFTVARNLPAFAWLAPPDLP